VGEKSDSEGGDPEGGGWRWYWLWGGGQKIPASKNCHMPLWKKFQLSQFFHKY